MSIEQDGFLSPEFDAQAAAAIATLAPELVDFVREVNRLGLAVFLAPRPSETRDFALVAGTLVGRAVQDFEAAVILATRGLRAQSRSLVRSGLETAMYCAAAASDLVLKDGLKIKPKRGNSPAEVRFLDALDGSHQRYRIHIAKGLQKVSPAPQGHPDEMGSLIDELGDIGSHQDIVLSGLAADLGLSDLYEILYRRLSQDAHPSATALEHHIAADEAGRLQLIRMGPDYSEFRDTLLLATCSMLIALEGYLSPLGTINEQARCHALTKEYQRLDSSPNAAA